MKKHTITVGIPAFNEEKNIGHLLNKILKQSQIGIDIQSIFVVSDGSTDCTSEEVKKIKNPHIRFVQFPKRRGRAIVQQYIMDNSNTDNVVLLDADTILKDKLFIKRLVQPNIDGADLSSARIEEVTPKTVIEKILFASMRWKKDLFERVNSGDNVYTCHGRARAFSQRLYKKIKFKQSVGEDAYSYFICKKENMKYVYVKNARIYYKLPSNWHDHVSQSKRYFVSKKIFIKHFGADVIKRSYKLPIIMTLESFIKGCIKTPWLLLYFPLSLFIKIDSIFDRSVKNTWNISQTSKFITT